MDNDLISRSALLSDIEDTVVISARNTKSAEMRGIHKVTDRIKASPDVDAVPVVRCEKCKHTETDGCEDPAIYCKKWDRWKMPPDFYCGYGERKTE